MAWQTDIKDATYTSPSGKVFTFHYNPGVSKETDLKGAVFTFPEKDGALVVPLGLGGRRFPMTCNFYGETCLEDADAFEAGLEERGYGELQHPVYGVHKVVPTGTIKRSDDLSSGLNLSTIEVTFYETIIDETYPESKSVSVDEIENTMDKYEEIAAAEFNQNLDISSIKENVRSANNFKKNLRIITDNIEAIAAKSKSCITKVQQMVLELQDNIDDFANSIQDVAVQSIKIVRLPARIAIGASAKLGGYSSAVTSILKNLQSEGIGVKAAKNQFVSTSLLISGLCAALAAGVAESSQGSGELDNPADESSSSTEHGTTFYKGESEDSNNAAFKCREDAVEMAESILDLYDTVTDYIDSKVGEDLVVDTGESFRALSGIISTSVDVIINQSFALPTRKIVTLGRDRQIMELLSEFYGNFDRIDEFIADNQLTFDEIQLIPQGRQVAYYV